MRKLLSIATHLLQLMGVISKILDFGKIESQRMVLEHCDFKLRQLLSDVFEVSRYKVCAVFALVALHSLG